MRCDECGYDYDVLPRDALSRRIVDLADEVARALRALDHPAALRRPAAGVWSPLEYACHVRDVLLFQDRRVRQAQEEDEPRFAPMNRDERALAERYNEQEPAVVAAETGAAAEALAATLDTLPGAGWARTGGYGHPQPQLVTVEWVARHTVHELVHHLLDIERQTRPAAG
jgi:DinB superfamily